MNAKRIGFIGGGRIARILLGGRAKAGKMPEEIAASDPDAKSLERLAAVFPNVRNLGSDNATAVGQRIVFLAVYPPAVGEVLPDVKQSRRPCWLPWQQN